ncbi:Ribosome-inactivating protein 9 [Dichanthelium oligosanthes]|uniref:rRNA N-glycosylase n=1 Tax=Dichanthelium oligosanthes TaxID=888268 RepID=A0A1E5VF31_9POAL|nr:Ribosome-inactivating protein 9 [Dichanthelium oligosanthes]
MAVPKPVFTDSFLVEEKTQNYGDFIRIVRQNVIKYCSDRRPGIVQPVLPPEEKVPKIWFHVVLRTKTRSLTLAIRMDNLYLVGFMTPAGVWWEFNNEQKKHLIKDAKWLGFGGRYQDLIGDKGLETVTLGRAEMAAAVNVLADHHTRAVSEEEEELLQQQDQDVLLEEDDELRGVVAADPYGRPKSKLVRLVIMVCEGLRFLTVSSRVEKGFDDEMVILKLTPMEGKQVQKWDRISAAVFKWAKDPSAKIDEMEELDIKNKTAAEKIVVLVKDQN